MKEKSFEETLERLGQIVADMESGNLSLEDSLKQYEEGIKCARLCKEKLEQAEKKVELLVKQADGTVSLEPFETDSTAPSAQTTDVKPADTPVAQSCLSPTDIIDNQQDMTDQDSISDTSGDTDEKSVEPDKNTEPEKSDEIEKKGLTRCETVDLEKNVSDNSDGLLF